MPENRVSKHFPYEKIVKKGRMNYFHGFKLRIADTEINFQISPPNDIMRHGRDQKNQGVF